MPDQIDSPELNPDILISRLKLSLDAAVEAVQPGASEQGLSALDVFPEPSELRADTQFDIDLSNYQESAFRSAMAELGVGSEENETAEQVGLNQGFIAVIEAGQAHKIVAELNVLEQGESLPVSYILTATPERELKDQEKEVTARVLGISVDEVANNEYDMVQQVLASREAFSPSKQALNYKYDKSGAVSQTSGTSETGQFVKSGSIHGKSVLLLRIDREHYEDSAGIQKYRQPGTQEVISIVDQIVDQYSGEDDPIGFVTSKTYKPSRVLDAAMFSKSNQRKAAVISYGTAELAGVKGEPQPTQPALGQLAGEAHKVAQLLAKLES